MVYEGRDSKMNVDDGGKVGPSPGMRASRYGFYLGTLMVWLRLGPTPMKVTGQPMISSRLET